MIRLLNNSEIDRRAWDACIAASCNEVPYAYSWFLDVVCSDWCALVEGDYVCVMPLPVRRYAGCKLVLQPMLTQQLGIFSPSDVTVQMVEAFVAKIPWHNVVLNLNEGNRAELRRGSCKLLPNYCLATEQDYETLQRCYNTNTRRNVKKARCSMHYAPSVSMVEFVSLVRAQNYCSAKLCAMAERLVTEALAHGCGRIVGVRNAKGMLCAACFLLESKSRTVYHIAASSSEGKAHSAMFLLVDELVRELAGTGRVIDFEGSQIAGVARFYEGFGATVRYYQRLEYGVLPFIKRSLCR